jgi:NAD(P)-dependent dehydrogenase (short-subunit alcohol dehydrogenase family)
MTFSPTALQDRTILVTGASSGLGRATAALIAQCGGRVIATGRDETRLAAAVASLAGKGHAPSSPASTALTWPPITSRPWPRKPAAWTECFTRRAAN